MNPCAPPWASFVLAPASEPVVQIKNAAMSASEWGICMAGLLLSCASTYNPAVVQVYKRLAQCIAGAGNAAPLEAVYRRLAYWFWQVTRDALSDSTLAHPSFQKLFNEDFPVHAAIL